MWATFIGIHVTWELAASTLLTKFWNWKLTLATNFGYPCTNAHLCWFEPSFQRPVKPRSFFYFLFLFLYNLVLVITQHRFSLVSPNIHDHGAPQIGIGIWDDWLWSSNFHPTVKLTGYDGVRLPLCPYRIRYNVNKATSFPHTRMHPGILQANVDKGVNWPGLQLEGHFLNALCCFLTLLFW